MVRVFISASLRPSKSTGYDRPSGRTWDWSSHRPIPGIARSSVPAEDTSNVHGPSRGSGSSSLFWWFVPSAVKCRQGRGSADNAGSLSRFIVNKSRSLNAFKAAASTRPCHRPPKGLSGIRLGTPPAHGNTPLTDLALRKAKSCLQAVLRNISRWKTVAPERDA
jgi:hypothetical protein